MDGFKYAFGELLPDISKPFIIGIFIAGIITLIFPDNIADMAADHQFYSMLIMLILGIPMYVCATSSTPIAAALILKGLNPGAALVFLLAGPATNAATINIVRKVFNFRALVIYLSMIAVCSLGIGFFVDWIYTFYSIHTIVTGGMASELIPYKLRLVAAFVLTTLILYNWIVNLQQHARHHSSH